MISYIPLSKLLIEKGINKTQLKESIGCSSTTIAKMAKGEYISLEVIEKICKHLGCKIEDVVEII